LNSLKTRERAWVWYGAALILVRFALGILIAVVESSRRNRDRIVRDTMPSIYLITELQNDALQGFTLLTSHVYSAPKSPI
jgi:hypothetical protein